MTQGATTRILFCENNVDGTVGGSYYSLLYLVKGLDRTRYRPTVVFYSDHILVPAFRQAGADVLIWSRSAPYSLGASGRGGLKALARLLAPVRKALNFARGFVVEGLTRAWFLKRNGFDLVHLNNSILQGHDWMLAARLTGTPCVSHERGINEYYPRAARYFGSGLGAIVCISDAVRTTMERQGADFGNLVTIHNGLDPEALAFRTSPEALRREWALADDTPVVVMVGNIKAWKGQETLVRAIDRVRRTHPSVRCLLVGDTSPLDRSYDATLRELIASLGLTEHVLFTGFQRHVADFMRMADVVVHASVAPEPFGRVILEAMACRKPVVGSRAGAIPEIIEEGETGLTFPPGDAEALAAALERVLADPAGARSLGDRGYDRLIARFHIAQNVQATERVYEGLSRASD
jgi:glycosyltransferase involved in cell wall biosynthesis